MSIRKAHILFVALALSGTACSRGSPVADCDLALEKILNSEAIKGSPSPVEAALNAIQQNAADECSASDPALIGSKAYFLYGLGRISESEQLILQLNWRGSGKSIVLRTAVLLIVHEQRLGNDLSVAEELARRVVSIMPEDPKSHLLLGEALIARGRHEGAVEAFEGAQFARASAGLRQINGFDLNFIPSLFAQGSFEDALAVFEAARDNPNFGLWERKGLILAGLYSAESLGQQQKALSIIAETEKRRPDIASSTEFQEAKQSVLSMSSLGPSD